MSQDITILKTSLLLNAIKSQTWHLHKHRTDLNIWQPCIWHDNLHNFKFSVKYLKRIGFILYAIKRQLPFTNGQLRGTSMSYILVNMVYSMKISNPLSSAATDLWQQADRPMGELPQIYGSRLTSPWENCHRFTALTLNHWTGRHCSIKCTFFHLQQKTVPCNGHLHWSVIWPRLQKCALSGCMLNLKAAVGTQAVLRYLHGQTLC